MPPQGGGRGGAATAVAAATLDRAAPSLPPPTVLLFALLPRLRTLVLSPRQRARAGERLPAGAGGVRAGARAGAPFTGRPAAATRPAAAATTAAARAGRAAGGLVEQAGELALALTLRPDDELPGRGRLPEEGGGGGPRRRFVGRSHDGVCCAFSTVEGLSILYSTSDLIGYSTVLLQ